MPRKEFPPVTSISASGATRAALRFNRSNFTDNRKYTGRSTLVEKLMNFNGPLLFLHPPAPTFNETTRRVRYTDPICKTAIVPVLQNGTFFICPPHAIVYSKRERTGRPPTGVRPALLISHRARARRERRRSVADELYRTFQIFFYAKVIRSKPARYTIVYCTT